MSHDFSGIARGLRGCFREGWRNVGNVSSEQRMNWAKVIRGPEVGCSLLFVSGCYMLVEGEEGGEEYLMIASRAKTCVVIRLAAGLNWTGLAG